MHMHTDTHTHTHTHMHTDMHTHTHTSLLNFRPIFGRGTIFKQYCFETLNTMYGFVNCMYCDNVILFHSLNEYNMRVIINDNIVLLQNPNTCIDCIRTRESLYVYIWKQWFGLSRTITRTR